MENYFKNLQGGIFVLIKRNETYKYFFSENSMFLIDDWESDILNGKYFDELNKYETPFLTIKASIEELKNELTNEKVENIINWKMPELYIDFDKNELFSNYYDQALEDRIPESWKGKFIENKKEFIKLIPVEFNYWK